jgi:hypothetical protein
MKKEEMKKYLYSAKTSSYSKEIDDALKVIKRTSEILPTEELSEDMVRAFVDIVITRNRISYLKFYFCDLGMDVVGKMSNVEYLADEMVEAMRNSIIGTVFKKRRNDIIIAAVKDLEDNAYNLSDENIKDFIERMYLFELKGRKIDKRRF